MLIETVGLHAPTTLQEIGRNGRGMAITSFIPVSKPKTSLRYAKNKNIYLNFTYVDLMLSDKLKLRNTPTKLHY